MFGASDLPSSSAYTRRVKVLTLGDDANTISVYTSNGTAEVLLLAVPFSGSGVTSVTAAPGDAAITVDNTDPANPTLQNTGVHTVDVNPPLLLITAAPHVLLGIDTSSLGGTGARANKNMAASATTADGQLGCATAVAVTPAGSSSSGGYVGAALNGVLLNVGDGVKTTECYFSGDGGVTARAMKAIVSGDRIYWNGSIAGYQLAASDLFSFFYNVTT